MWLPLSWGFWLIFPLMALMCLAMMIFGFAGGRGFMCMGGRRGHAHADEDVTGTRR